MRRHIGSIALTASAIFQTFTLASSLHAQEPELDSVVLVRTQTAFRSGPAYRVRLSRDGDVHFESRCPSDLGRVATSRIDPDTARNLLARARALGIDSLPGDLTGKPPYCRTLYTDFPTVIIELYGPQRAYRLRDYQGCIETRDESPGGIIQQLRAFEKAREGAVGTLPTARLPKLARRPRRHLLPAPRHFHCPS